MFLFVVIILYPDYLSASQPKYCDEGSSQFGCLCSGWLLVTEQTVFLHSEELTIYRVLGTLEERVFQSLLSEPQSLLLVWGAS